MIEQPESVPAVYWQIKKLGGRQVTLWPQHLPEDARDAVLTAYRKSGYIVQRVEQYANGTKNYFTV